MTDFNSVAAIDPARSIQPELIRRLLDCGETAQAGRDGEFTGRPMTTLLADGELVLKKRGELRYRPGDDERWIRQTVDQERRLGLHHPAKTWLIIKEAGERSIANVTPRLRPLDHWLPDSDSVEGITVIERLLQLYTQAFVYHERQLDPGLSNFGTDAEGRLFYLDDESSPARGLASLAAAIASWFRVIPWIDDEAGAQIGRGLRATLLEAFEDPHPVVVVRDQLRAAFFTDDRQANAIAALITELVPIGRKRPETDSRRGMGEKPARYLALIADIHGNRVALERALAHIDALPEAELWVLGDIVGYGPEPGACIERLRERPDALIIKGNHDHAVALGRATSGFSPIARQVIDWTIGELSADDRSWLMDLPAVHHAGDWLAVHGAPQDPTYFNGYVYHMTYASNLDNLAERAIPFCVHGHTHVAGAYSRKGHRYAGIIGGALNLADADHWLICPGSVGQPRGGSPGCELAVIDRDNRTVDLLRLEYDIDAAVKAIHQAGLPSHLGDRLWTGR